MYGFIMGKSCAFIIMCMAGVLIKGIYGRVWMEHSGSQSVKPVGRQAGGLAD